jgi:competence protein ComEC
MHLAVVAMLLFGAVRLAWAAVPAAAMRLDPGRAAAMIAAPAALAYTMLTGAQTATLRALVVVLAVLLGVVVRRRLRVIDAIGLAAALILIDRPSAIGDASFQLSFAAAITLCAVPRTGRAWLHAVKISVAVTLTTAPITAWHFHQVSVGGVIGNLVLGPIVELLVIPMGLAGLVFGPLLDAAIAIAGVVDRGARALAGVTPVIEVPPPRLAEIAAWYAVLAGWWWRPRRGAMLAIALGLAVGTASVTWSCAAPRARTDLRVTFLDVGQGDAAVIELPGGAVWLVDAGGNPMGSDPANRGPGEALLRYLRARRIARIDVAVISHPHPDHYLGLLALAGRVEIGELWVARPPPGEVAPAPEGYPGFEAVLRALHTRVVHPPLGTALRDHGVALEVLAPVYDDGDGPQPIAAADPVRSVNDDSLVVALRFAGRRVLFAGDIEREGEDALLGAGAFADVVKVPHHGSPTSSSPALVAATHARLAVISCGRANRFGFPDPEVVARWQAAGASVLRTDRAGAVTVEIEPTGRLHVTTFD